MTQALDLTVESENFAAEMWVEVKVDSPQLVDNLSNEMKIADIPVPGAAMMIIDIFTLGLRVEFVAGFGTRAKNGFAFKAGMSVKVPGTAKMTLDAVQWGNNAVEGFDAFELKPKMSLKSLSSGADLSLSAKPKLVFGIDVIDKISAEIGMILNFPELKGTCIPKYSMSAS